MNDILVKKLPLACRLTVRPPIVTKVYPLDGIQPRHFSIHATRGPCWICLTPGFVALVPGAHPLTDT